MDDFDEAHRIALILHGYIARFNNLISASPPHLDEVDLKAQASALKEDIRAEHKRLGASKYRPESPIEQAFLIPAIRQANGEFSKYPITSPSSGKWAHGLDAARGELVYHMGRLTQKFPGVASAQAR
jgi:hypothetical protein